MVFFIKHVIPWLRDQTMAPPIRSEVCQALRALLPLIDDLYGSHWVDILDALAESWTAQFPVQDASRGNERYDQHTTSRRVNLTP